MTPQRRVRAPVAPSLTEQKGGKRQCWAAVTPVLRGGGLREAASVVPLGAVSLEGSPCVFWSPSLLWSAPSPYRAALAGARVPPNPRP
jgi:hypothetical protein